MQKKNVFNGKCVKRHERGPQHTYTHTSWLWGKSITIWRMQHNFLGIYWINDHYIVFFLHETFNKIDSSHCLESIFRAHHIHTHTHKIHVCKMWKRWTYYHFWYKLNCKPNAHDVSFGTVFFLGNFCERFCLAFDFSFAFCKFHSVLFGFFKFIFSLLDKRVVFFWKYIFIF